jgi:hypothetical protein
MSHWCHYVKNANVPLFPQYKNRNMLFALQIIYEFSRIFTNSYDIPTYGPYKTREETKNTVTI